ncbi:hypothetical protein D3C72_2068380 [compost metagenome]
MPVSGSVAAQDGMSSSEAFHADTCASISVFGVLAAWPARMIWSGPNHAAIQLILNQGLKTPFT